MLVVWRLATLALTAAAAAGLVWSVRHREPAEPPGPPVLDFPREVNVGPQPFNSIAEGRFRIDNRGGSVLSLNRFSTSCSCAGVEIVEDGVAKRVEELHIPPGGHVDLNVRIAVGARSGTSQTVYVSFATNDPDRPAGTVTAIIPQVTGGVYTEPSAVVFGELPVGGRPASRTVRVYDNGTANRTIREVRSLQPDRFSARLLPLDGTEPAHETAGRCIAVVEVVPRTDRPGRLDGTIEVVPADEARPPDTLAVLGEVVSEVVARPAALFLPRHANGQPMYSGQVALSSRDGAELSVAVESVPDSLTATVRADPDNPGQWLLEVTARPTGIASQTVTIRLRANLRPSKAFDIEVPVTLSPVTQ